MRLPGPRALSDSKFARRRFLAAWPGAFWAIAGNSRVSADDNPLHVLPDDKVDRLRLDFNASRSKVRLLFLLSPT